MADVPGGSLAMLLKIVLKLLSLGVMHTSTLEQNFSSSRMNRESASDAGVANANSCSRDRYLIGLKKPILPPSVGG